MRILKRKKKRIFIPSKFSKSSIKDCAKIILKPNEQVTFLTSDGKEYDFTRTYWGYYATPSINFRLKKNKFLSFIIKSKINSKFFVMVVEKQKINLFKKYLKQERLKIIPWPKK